MDDIWLCIFRQLNMYLPEYKLYDYRTVCRLFNRCVLRIIKENNYHVITSVATDVNASITHTHHTFWKLVPGTSDWKYLENNPGELDYYTYNLHLGYNTIRLLQYPFVAKIFYEGTDIINTMNLQDLCKLYYAYHKFCSKSREEIVAIWHGHIHNHSNPVYSAHNINVYFNRIFKRLEHLYLSTSSTSLTHQLTIMRQYYVGYINMYLHIDYLLDSKDIGYVRKVFKFLHTNNCNNKKIHKLWRDYKDFT